MQFNGKYTLLSTNTEGPQLYLTSASSSGLTYPVVAATTATQTERLITYVQDDNSLVIEMGNLFYLTGEDQVGWVVATEDPGAAYSFQMTVEDGGDTVSLQVYVPALAQWEPVRYSINPPLSYLVYPISTSPPPPPPGTLLTFTPQLITPSLTTIQASKTAQGYDFQNVNLADADLSGVDCTGADFRGAILDGASLAGANLTSALFAGASLQGTDLTGATLDQADFTGTNLSTVTWGSGISAQQAVFTGCTAIGCQIGSSSPSVQANFTGATFTGADFTGSDFSYAILDGATLLQAVFVGTTLEGVSFVQAQLGGLASSAAADLSFAYMPNVNFGKANLFGVSFAFGALFGASTSLANAATLEQVDFSNAYLEGINLAGAALQGAKFNNACLVNVDFTTANLSPTLAGSTASSLAGACLQGAIFTQANLSNANLTNATVAAARGTINVRYCYLGAPFPPAPGFEPLNYQPTVGLDLTSMSASTICPNGLTVAANQQQGNSLQQMLSVTHPATEWVPVHCYAPGQTVSPRTKAIQPHPDVVLETPHATLRTCSLRHFRHLRALADLPDVRRYLFNDEDLTDARLKALIHHYRVRQRRQGISRWPAYRTTDGAFIGLFGLDENPLAGGLEINVAVRPEFRGDPLVKELYRAVLHYGFARLGRERIYGLIDPDNRAAATFATRLGFRWQGRLQAVDTSEYDLYQITEAEMVTAMVPAEAATTGLPDPLPAG